VAQDADLVAEYTLIGRTREFPDVVVFFDGATHYGADGEHRALAAQERGETQLWADVRQGGLTDAIWYAAAANTEHGARPTPKDRQKAVKNCLRSPSLSQRSDTVIAERCGVSLAIVSRIRAALNRAAEAPAAPAAEPRAIAVSDRRGRNYTMRASGSRAGGRPSKAKAAALKKKTATDPLGQTIPEWARTAFADGCDFDAVCEFAGEITKRVEALKARPSGAAIALDVPSIAGLVQEIRNVILNARPYCVCPDCAEKSAPVQSCPTCDGDGWLTREQYNRRRLTHTEDF
jgi:hypothetical protein